MRTKPGTTAHMGRPGKIYSGGDTGSFHLPKGRNYQPNFGSLGQHPDHAVAYTSVGGHDTADFSSIVDDDHARESVKDRA